MPVFSIARKVAAVHGVGNHPLIEVRPDELAHGRLDHVPSHAQQGDVDAWHVEGSRGGVTERFGRRGDLRDDIEAAQAGGLG